MAKLSPRGLRQRLTNRQGSQTTVEDVNDLGFGSRVVEESKLRLLNRDGSFNARRTGLSFFQSLHLYQSLLTVSWTRFFLTAFAAYVVVNALFAVGFVLCGPEALSGAAGGTLPERFMEAFFFSVQTFTTVGFGHLSPNSFAADVLVTVDAFVGLLAFALAAGIVFARFSRPTAQITFSARRHYALSGHHRLRLPDHQRAPQPTHRSRGQGVASDDDGRRRAAQDAFLSLSPGTR